MATGFKDCRYIKRAEGQNVAGGNWVVTAGNRVVKIVVSPKLVPLSILLMLGSMGLFMAACEERVGACMSVVDVYQ